MPEERNRVMTDHLSALLFTPTRTAVDNHEREGIVAGMFPVGDVMLDAFLAAPPDLSLARPILDALGLRSRAFVLATLHRAETTATAEGLRSRLAFLLEISEGRPVLMPLQPRTGDAARRLGVSLDGVTVVEPVDYRTFSSLLSQCALVATDSGGVQKEAYFHRVPCVTLRSETEWPETIQAGWNRLWTDPEVAMERQEIDDYGAGRAAAAILDCLVAAYEGGKG
jgi:UDP-GlcNAc3NAcA epimerase